MENAVRSGQVDRCGGEAAIRADPQLQAPLQRQVEHGQWRQRRREIGEGRGPQARDGERQREVAGLWRGREDDIGLRLLAVPHHRQRHMAAEAAHLVPLQLGLFHLQLPSHAGRCAAVARLLLPNADVVQPGQVEVAEWMLRIAWTAQSGQQVVQRSGTAAVCGAKLLRERRQRDADVLRLNGGWRDHRPCQRLRAEADREVIDVGVFRAIGVAHAHVVDLHQQALPPVAPQDAEIADLESVRGHVFQHPRQAGCEDTQRNRPGGQAQGDQRQQHHRDCHGANQQAHKQMHKSSHSRLFLSGCAEGHFGARPASLRESGRFDHE